MGIGPRFAIPPALEAAKITLKDVDLIELNEAFASQVYCLRIILMCMYVNMLH
jgi:acetyl-CoA acetyltransferase